ncbi:hypothetical protein FRC00_009650 [Tulasnella sp. 408]|nr:hypothetical protein FRC00_009650 [Tulasnella sp. 408]
MTGSGTRENPFDLSSPIESSGSVPNPPSGFSTWTSDIVRVQTPQVPLQPAASAPIAGPSNQPPPGDHNREGSDQIGYNEPVQNNDDEMDLDGGDLGQQLDEEAIEELRRKINSSIVVGTRTVLNSRQRWTRTKMFDLEMSEAKGGLVFDHDEPSIIFGLICRIHDSRRIQEEEGPTLIVVPSETHFNKWGTAARDFSDQFNLHNILIYHGRNRSPGT